MKGVIYWNTHAFNLTAEDSVMHGRLNYLFADNQKYPVNNVFNASRIFAANAAPYTTQTVCSDHVLPQGARLFALTSHTHKRGKLFQAWAPDGSQIFENHVYNDPVKQGFDPPLAFDSADPAERTIRYCALYNNGLDDDGSANVETVTRASRVPESARRTIGGCKPVACVAGKVGAACAGSDDDASCDSSPGAGDGDCDACRITGGESTENEMFILIGSTYIADGFPQPDIDDPIFGGPASASAALDASGRSTYTRLALPASFSCSSGAGSGAHAGHTMP
jgi:hypothetical protein